MSVTARLELPAVPGDVAFSESRAFNAALYCLLAIVFVTGGSSQQRGWTDALAQLLALPVIAVASWRICSRERSKVLLLGVGAMAAIAVLPWLQLLPLSGPLWRLSPARADLAKDLALVGVLHPASTWSLAPAATLRGALSLLPAVALFGGVLSVATATQRRLLGLCVVLPIASLLLGFLQLGAPQESLLNPYPQWAPAMGGVFANPNHQGTAMLVGLGICLAHVFGPSGPWREPERFDGRQVRPGYRWFAAIAGSTLFLGLPLTDSRAVAIIGVLMLVAAPLAMTASTLKRSGRGKVGLLVMALVVAAAVLGLSAAATWMKVDELQGTRGMMRAATMALATRHLPWGSGIGSFVPVFQQAMPVGLLRAEYINAAHDDFAQIWLEAGIAGLLVAGLAAWAAARALFEHRRTGSGERSMVWSALLGLFPLVAHAFTDFALRTPALMAVAALLFGVLVAQGDRNR